jgi:ABC-type phosphate/phosphonate transport system substrate-binding protein
MIGTGASQYAYRVRRRSISHSGMIALLFICGIVPLSAADDADQRGVTDNVLRLAFSSKMFTEVKVEDARAAMKAWMMTVARERGIPVDPEPRVYDSLEEMLRASQGSRVEGFAVTAEECLRLSKEIKLDRFAVGVHNGRMTEEYVILVHRDSGIEGVGDLRGRSLMLLETPRMSLATVWLDTVLLLKGLHPTATLCSSVTSANRLTQVVLPVFFRKSDACLVTRRGFQTMSELNPQVGKQLRILAASPEVVPSGFAFRSDYASPYRAQMMVEIGSLADSPAGQQILTLLQTDRIEDQPISCLAGAFELLATHQRLSSATNRAKAVGGGRLPGETKPGGNR